MGDFNIHQMDWFTFSARNSCEGKELQDVACSHVSEQIARAPTRDRYLLDLVLTDCDLIAADVVLGFSDHFGTKVTITFALPEQSVVERFLIQF